MKQKDCHYTTREIAEAISVVNRHAKTAPQPKQLYTLKRKSIQKLLHQKQAKKVGLHYSEHPTLSKQHTTLLIQVEDFYFHLPPEKNDLNTLKHLGHINHEFRNPKPQLSLKRAKQILYHYLGWKPVKKSPGRQQFPSVSSWVSGQDQQNWRKKQGRY
ncbi:MAG: hypothetical protein H0Z32_03265 [Bacillaceae bacterium]|nr:hypothetical protein [Bacillaceae bacterium]